MARRLISLLVLVLLLIGLVGAGVLDVSPVAGGGVSLDLAAIAGAAIDGVIGEATSPEGLERAYQSFYVTLDGTTVIDVFLLKFGSAEEAGAGIVDAALRPPLVAVSVSAFETPEDALAVLEAIRQAPNDLPTAYPVPRGVRTIIANRVIPGATATLAYEASFNEEDPSAIDSAGVDFVVGSWLVTVDVQGGLTADAAMAAAVDLATQQAGCLVAGGECDSVTRPAELTA